MERVSVGPTPVKLRQERRYVNARRLKIVGLPCVDRSGISWQSIKCSECGKVFKNTALANFHAEKSGHDQFEESTEEVRAER